MTKFGVEKKNVLTSTHKQIMNQLFRSYSSKNNKLCQSKSLQR